MRLEAAEVPAQRPLPSRLWRALGAAAKCGFFAGAAMMFYFVATIFMVGGDGTAPWITRRSGDIIQQTASWLGFFGPASLVITVLFWSSVVSVAAFLWAMGTRPGPAPDPGAVNRANRTWTFVVLGVFALFVLLAVNGVLGPGGGSRWGERKAVAEFVRTNTALMQRVGGNPSVSVSAPTRRGDNFPYYEVDVRGTKEVCAVVEASRRYNAASTFRLVCAVEKPCLKLEAQRHPCRN
jgi:hypothetical protein